MSYQLVAIQEFFYFAKSVTDNPDFVGLIPRRTLFFVSTTIGAIETAGIFMSFSLDF